MGVATTTRNVSRSSILRRHGGKLTGAAVGLLLLTLGVLLFIVPRWPFREADMRKRIESATGAKVQFAHFHQFFLAHPGCTAEGVTITPADPSRPKISIRKLTVYGLYTGLVGKEKHLHAMDLEGLQVFFPPKDSSHAPANPPGQAPAKNESHPTALSSDIRFDHVKADNSELVFAADEQHPHQRTFEIHRVVLTNFSPRAAIHFSSLVHIQAPTADVQATGVFGPLTGGPLGETPLSGEFNLQNGDFSNFQALFGKLTAKGNFKGKLEALQTNGSTDSPDFGLTKTRHNLPLHTEFSALVNGMNGDIELQPVHAVLGETALVAEGQLTSPKEGKGKTLTINFTSDNARIEDLLYLFVHQKSPIQGPTRFQMKVLLPDDHRPFVRRVEAEAHFGILNSKFTTSETQQKVSQLSEKARGNPKDPDPPMVVTNLVGDVSLKDGTANFSRLSCGVPGAAAVLHGTYQLESERINLHGTLQTQVKLSQATTGFKAFLVKVVEFAKAKKKKGATVPVKITGTYSKPEFALDVTSEK